jgi:hypothetical protein
MLRTPLGRRDFVRSAALTGAGLAAGAHLALVPRTALALSGAGGLPETPLGGDVHAWVRVGPGGATALLACSGTAPGSYLPTGPAVHLPEPASTAAASSWDRMRQASAAARALIVETAARGWDVSPASCHAEPACVVHPASGRRRGYTIWVDVLV